MTKIMLVGATGLIGQQVRHEAKSPLHILARRTDAEASQHKTIIAESEQWPNIIARERPDVMISCLGTTRRKAGSNEAFAAVDRDLALAVAQAAKQAGARQMVAVSSVGANAKSSNFYLSVKGAAEDGMKALGFDRLDIMRPGLLRGDRAEHRPGESFALMVAPLTDSLIPDSWSRYRSISATQVAHAILAVVEVGGNGHFIHENDSIKALAG